jgi:hypothetical protein
MSQLLAQIGNPTVPGLDVTGGNSGTVGASILEKYIALGIQTAIVVGALAVLVYFFLGAIRWITSGGDKGSLEKARQQMVQAAVGLLVLVSLIAVIDFIGPILFGFNILELNFVNQITEPPSSSTGSGSNYIGPISPTGTWIGPPQN